MIVKEAFLENRSEDGQAIVSVVLEDGGEEYPFSLDAWEWMDTEERETIMREWKEKNIPRIRSAVAKTNEERLTEVEATVGENAILRVKKAELLEQLMVSVVLEEGGEEYPFGAGVDEWLDTEEREKIIRYWKDKVLPKRRSVAAMKDEELIEAAEATVGENGIMRVKRVSFKRIEDRQALISVILEDGVKEYPFVADAWEWLDTEERAGILINWKNHIIPKRNGIAVMSTEEIMAKVSETVGETL